MYLEVGIVYMWLMYTKIIMSLLRWLYVTVQTSRQHYTGSYSSTAFHDIASDTEVSSYFVYNHDVDIVDVHY